MFPTFISILDIQSWWEVPSIAHFCSLFRSAFNLLDFDIEDLEEALLTDGTEETSWLQELIVRLLSGCLPNNEISTFNYQMFLRRLFRQKCQEHDQYNPFNTDVDFQILPLRTKVDILHALCDFRLDADDVLDQLKNLEADSLRVEPLGYDSNESAFWYFYGTRLYREDFKTKNNKKQSVWQVICFTEEDWFQLTKKFKKSTSKVERQLYKTLSENFLPELPRLFKEKERLARKRLLENQPRRTSSRIRKLELTVEKEKDDYCRSEEVSGEQTVDEEAENNCELGIKHREASERRNKLKDQELIEDSNSELSENSYEMAKTRTNRSKTKNVSKPTRESSGSKDKANNKKGKNHKKTDTKESPTIISATTKVGRQTNNSLAAATGQIVIEPVINPHRKKLKTSQVFCQTDEDLQTGMHKILDQVKNHEDAWPFVDPVDEDYAPNYYSVIRKPMDLQRMEERLDSGYYKSFSKFRNDFQLIVDNCRLYNGAENEYTEMVGTLLTVFERATEKYLDQISSSEDEIAVEYPIAESENESRNVSKTAKNDKISKKRKPTLAAKTDKKRETSPSERSVSLGRSESNVSLEVKNISEEVPVKKNKQSSRSNKKAKNKSSKTFSKKNKHDAKKNRDKEIKDKHSKDKSSKDGKVSKKSKKLSKNKKKVAKKPKTPSPVRGQSAATNYSSSSPPPSWPPSSPEDNIHSPSGDNPLKRKPSDGSDEESKKKKIKEKPKDDRWKALFENEEIRNRLDDKCKSSINYTSPPSPKPKDKHNKLRETIEKLKAKSEISHKLNDMEFTFDNVEWTKATHDKQPKLLKEDISKPKNKEKQSDTKKDMDVEDASNIVESEQSENKKAPKKNNEKSVAVRNSSMEALSLATEQTLKDINKWLDDTPKFSEFSSASNSPSYTGLDDFDTLNNKTEPDPPRKVEKWSKKEGAKDSRRRAFSRDPAKFLKRREIQRTIDRLQPGKSKGNLITTVQSSNKVDEIFPLGPLSKLKDTKNALIVKTDENAPKLSLGSVLDSFGKHKFIDDQKKEVTENTRKEEEPPLFVVKGTEETKKEETNAVEINDKPLKPVSATDDSNVSANSATPNLSAWFKAFGAPKIQPPSKKTDKHDSKEEDNKDSVKKVPVPEPSPNPDSPIMVHGQPVPRQRKISTGSSMSERSSFSQDMDSPRVGIDERLGAYPAPYPSPLHRSPSGASPVMASPRPELSPKAAYQTFNGQIRVGFYQDTVSTKSSPEKSCSPKDNPQSPHPQYSEHVYIPNTTHNINYSYASSPYYSHPPNYSHTIPTPPCNSETAIPHYDTNKALIDQYQSKTVSTFEDNSPISNNSSPSQPLPHSPNHNVVHTEELKVIEKPAFTPNAVFPVKKRVYLESEHQENVDKANTTTTLSAIEDPEETRKKEDCEKVEEKLTIEAKLSNYVDHKKPDSKSAIHLAAEGTSSAAKLLSLQENAVSNDRHSESLHNLHHYMQHPRPYNSTFNENFALSIPSARPLSATQETDRKIDMSQYTNMGYTGPEVNLTRSAQVLSRPDSIYSRSPAVPPHPQSGVTISQSVSVGENIKFSSSTVSLPSTYKPSNATSNSISGVQSQNLHTSIQSNSRTSTESLTLASTYKSDVSVPRPTYSTPSLDVNQPLSLQGNIANLSHIVDRYNNEERILPGLQVSSTYYSDKSHNPPHMFNKPTATSSSGLPIFSQAPNISTYNQNISVSSAPPAYSRQVTDIQNAVAACGDIKTSLSVPTQEKKTKKRKTAKTVSANSVEQPNSQGFQSYMGLKTNSSLEPSAISLKTASVVPGSAFNFGPTASGLGLGSGIYGDKDAYPNFLEEFRATPNYYMAAAAAAHHRSTPEGTDKQSRLAHQSTTPQASGAYPFITTPQGRAQSYPLGNPFINPTQAQLMDPSSPLYQHYLQAGVLNQGLLGPPGAYPPGYHPALTMRQPYDSMTRPSWL